MLGGTCTVELILIRFLFLWSSRWVLLETTSPSKALLLTTTHEEHFEVLLTKKKKSLIQITYKSACLTNHLVNILFTPITKCYCQHWTDGCDFAMGGNYCKDLQMLRVKRIRAHPQMGILYLPPNAQGTSCKRSHKTVRATGRNRML